MSQLMPLDTNEVTSWLTRVTQTIDRSLRDPQRAEATRLLSAGLEGTRAGLPVLTQLALLADCLHVAHLAIEADGRTESVEVERVADLVRVAASRYFAALPAYDSFGDHTASLAEVRRFLATHRADAGPFGYVATEAFRGLHLARAVEQNTRNATPLRDHERMLARVMDAVFGGRATEVERSARRKLRTLVELPTSATEDPRTTAFCRMDGPEVFASVAHGSELYMRDPYDIESIHAEARDALHRLVERATTPAHQESGRGRTLLVLGESGAGKTHLLRAMRTQVHGRRLGYVGYLQMTSEVGDYTRYVLRNLIDSLERPYDAPTLSESGLLYLSDGLVEYRVTVPPDELETLRTAELSGDELDAVVGSIIDQIVRTEGLEALEVDILHALLLLQRRDPAVQRRVIKYLRCEALTTHDRTLLGGLAAREQPEDPLRTLRQLARIMQELQLAALVLVVDQIEETVPDGVTVTRLQQAFDALRAIADSIPSSVVVISCLEDVYSAMRGKLSRSLVDRLEHEPTPVRLTSQRQPAEIEQMLARRLEHLYGFFDVPWRDDQPIFPFTSAQVEAVAQLRARDCLATFREYHAACIAGRTILAATSPTVEPTVTVTVSTPTWDRQWAEALEVGAAVADDDAGLVDLVERSLREAAREVALAVSIRREREGHDLRLVVELPTGRRVIGVCNRRPQGGHLGKQLEALKAQVAPGVTPIALRTSDFEFGNRSRASQQVGELRQAGGLPVVLTEAELRVVAVARDLAARPGFDDFVRARRPLSQLGFVRELLALDAAPAPSPTAVLPQVPLPLTLTTPPPDASGPRITGQIPIFDFTKVRLGVTATIRAEAQLLPLDKVKTHVAFLGTTGSGKTTAALSVIEQLLERGVSALLVDRKGDLARYADEAWWADPSHPDRARKRALRESIDISLFTPGNSSGRPLRLPLIPSFADAGRDERDQLAMFAATGLGAMMGYGTSATHGYKRSVLTCAIALHAGERDITLEVLLETINRPDPDLFRKVGSLQRHFAGLAEDLQSLQIQRSTLLAGDGEALDVGAMLPAEGSRPRLTIINTSAIGDVSILQFWVSRLLVELTRLSRRRPSPTLQGVAFFDEADAYVPATSSPPTKEPMFDLLRRARSGGLGVLLATQNPGDFDYRARDNISTWLVGKVAQDRAIEKMKNLIGAYPNVASCLATQPTGHFFVLADGRATEVRCDRSLMDTSQLGEAELATLARGTRK